MKLPVPLVVATLCCVILFGPSGTAAESRARRLSELDQDLRTLTRKENERFAALTAATLPAIIIVRLVIEIPGAGRDQPASEHRLEVNGTILNPQGLTALSLSAADPLARIEGGGGASSRFVSVQMVLAEGTEIPARIRTRDPESDLLLIAPEKKPLSPLPCVELMPERPPAHLDTLVVIGRLEAAAGRAPLVYGTSVSAVIRVPRTWYLVSAQGNGFPVFDLEGRCVGLLISWPRSGAGEFSPTTIAGLSSVVLPATEILETVSELKRLDASRRKRPRQKSNEFE